MIQMVVSNCRTTNGQKITKEVSICIFVYKYIIHLMFYLKIKY